MKNQIICALDTGDLNQALATVKRLNPYCGSFKIGHGLTLPYGLSVIQRLQDAGADRIFLDLKFHDIPHAVGLAVGEAAKCGVWMLTVHLSGGEAMLAAAVEQARLHASKSPPLIVGVSVLTSLNQQDLTETLGVTRTIQDHMIALSKKGMACGLDGVVCSVQEAAALRAAIGSGLIVTPGIRSKVGDRDDQSRVADGGSALRAGADYLVLGRALTRSDDPAAALHDLGLDVN